jgi:hypothetical protein
MAVVDPFLTISMAAAIIILAFIIIRSERRAAPGD